MADGIDWANLRYRGDGDDVRELFESYRVEHFLQASQENQRLKEQSTRHQLATDGILLTERISPRIYGLFHEVSATLSFETDVEVFCLPSTSINAFALVEPAAERCRSLIGITAPALDKLEDREICALLGHELGHFLFDNHRLNALLRDNKEGGGVTVLPPLGESLFLRWRKKAEISADRVSLLASGQFESAARCLLKAHFGLGEKNLNLDIPSLMGQIETMRGSRELMQASFRSHPLLPIRLAAVELFARSEKAARAGYACNVAKPLPDDALEGEIDALMALTRRAPSTPLGHSVMQVVAAGGILVLGADKEIGDSETKTLIEVLHEYFTDEPERVVDEVRQDPWAAIEAATPALRQHGGESDQVQVLSRLADVALADGALMDPEASVIVDVAERMGASPRLAYGAMVGAAQAVGFRFDAKLNRIAAKLRQELAFGAERRGAL
jgi:uncharacterized tellurite resistance protein B-like protein